MPQEPFDARKIGRELDRILADLTRMRVVQERLLEKLETRHLHRGPGRASAEAMPGPPRGTNA